MHCLSISTESPLYQQERELRNRVLLRPIGLPDYGWEMKDRECVHIVAVDDIVVGCVLLWPSGGQLLQMAVSPELQGRGVGRLLVDALVGEARSRGLERVYCHARANVIPFYTKLGFVGVGEMFQEVGLDHQVMELKL